MREIQQTIQFNVSPKTVYEALMDSDIQSIFTDSECYIGKEPGDPYDAYDGYIEGNIVELVPYSRIVQTWVANEDAWPQDHVCTIVFEFIEIPEGTELKFTHKDVPDNLYDAFYDGWIDHYWEPMKDYFATLK